MPQLTRIRMASIGHENARIDDITIPFTGPDGRATDTTLWLRNGGGKSSILNLLFSVVLPGRRNFLGANTEERRRRLEDYVAPNDRSVVALEWEMDGKSALLPESPSRFIAGVFYEWPNGVREEKKSPNLTFFCTRSVPSCPELTLEGLPLYTDVSRKRRRVLRSFKERWAELREMHKSAQPRTLENHSEWLTILRDAQIDPDLFRYQVAMNSHEGGADVLFQFAKPSDFVDLVLDMALDPEIADTAAQEIIAFRDKLSRHTSLLLPEQKLIGELARRMQVLVAIAHERVQNTLRLGLALMQMTELKSFTGTRIATLEALILDAKTRLNEATANADRCHKGEKQAAAHEAGLERWIAEGALESAQAMEAAAAEQRAQIDYDVVLWGAATRLTDRRRHDQEAKLHEEQIERFRLENAPLHERMLAAARSFLAALRFNIERLSAEDRAVGEREKNLRQQAKNAESQSKSAAVRASQESGRAANLRSRLKGIVNTLKQFAKEGILQPRETPQPGVARWTEAQVTLTTEYSQRNLRLDEITESRRELESQVRRLNASASAADGEVAGEFAAVEVARKERGELERNDRLLASLGIETIDFERAADDIPATLRIVAREYDGRIVRLHLERAQHVRIIDYLDQHELLPPTFDVEAVLDVLRGHVNAWSGWAYIAENSGNDTQSVRALVARAPAIAAGVIVADAEIQEAERLLRAGTFHLDSPVLVVTISTFAEPATATGFVLGPTSNAHFDKKAGVTELLGRQQSLDTLENQIVDARESRTAIEQLGNAVARHQAQYPRGWIDEHLRRADEAGERATIAREHVVALDREAGRLEDEKRKILDRLGEIFSERATAVGHARSLQRFIADHPEPIAELEDTAARAEAAARAAATEATTLSEQATAWIDEAGTLASRRLAIAPEVQIFRSAQARVAEVQPADVTAAPGDTVVLEITYDSLRDEFNGKLAESGLRELLQQSRRLAGEASDKLNRFLSTRSKPERPVSEHEVAAALDALPDPSDAESKSLHAESEQKRIHGFHGSMGAQRKNAETDVQKAVQKCDALGGVPTLSGADVPDSPSDAAKRKAQHAALVARMRADAIEYSALAAEAQAEIAVSGRIAEKLRGANRHLDTLAESNADLLAHTKPATTTWLRPVSDDENESRSEMISGEFGQCRQAHTRLNQRRAAAAVLVQRWITDDQFEHLRSNIIQGLRSWSEEQLEKRSEELISELATRLANLEAEIADIDRDRVGILRRAATAALEAAKVVEALPRHSRLPDNIKNIGGSDFLAIKLGMPEDPAEQRALMENLVNRMVSDGKVPRGVDFAKEALRHMSRKLDIKMLFPDPHVGKRWKDIRDLAVLSGGERLTCATVLYCAIARMRAHKRGESVSPTSILILDNPIGKVSRRTFLDLQREVARAMGIQLIYTTAVNDYEALCALPNLIRFRNDRRDRVTGEALLEMDTTGDVLEIARLMRHDVLGCVSDEVTT